MLRTDAKERVSLVQFLRERADHLEPVVRTHRAGVVATPRPLMYCVRLPAQRGSATLRDRRDRARRRRSQSTSSWSTLSGSTTQATWCCACHPRCRSRSREGTPVRPVRLLNAGCRLSP